MEVSGDDLRLLPFYEFGFGRKLTEATYMYDICTTIAERMISYDIAKHGLERVQDENFGRSDNPYPGRPPTINVKRL